MSKNIKTKKITLFLPSLHGGGAERVFVNLANEFVARGFEIDLVLARKEGAYIKNVSNQVNVIDLKADRVLFSIVPLIRYLRRSRPHVLLSSMEHANIAAVVAKKISRVNTVVVIRVVNSLSSSLSGIKRTKKPMILFGAKLFYGLADKIIAISHGVANDLLKTTRIKKHVDVIYNPTITSDVFEKADRKPDHPWFYNNEYKVVLGAGRLTKQKNFTMLVEAFARVRKNINTRMIIVGEGEDRRQLQKLIDSLDLKDYVDLPGFVDNPYSYMANADVFVLPSLWDGLPNALIEALACGVSIVATDSPGGTREILANGKYGKLVPVGDKEELAKAIEITLKSPRKPEILKNRAKEFSVDKIANKYLEVILP